MILDHLHRHYHGKHAMVHGVPARGAAAVAAPPADAVELSKPNPQPEDSAEMAAFQKKKRFLTDMSLLAVGDIPAITTIAADFGWLPIPSPLLVPLNAFNAMTGALGLASDASVVRDCVSNPDVPLKDKIVDVAHLGNDLMNTGASMVPLFMTMNGPLSAAGLIFAGGQLLGTLGDAAKLSWDNHRGGEQSARADGDQPHRLVMDRFEKRMGQIPVLLACVGSQSLLGHGMALALPAALAGTMVAFGGAFGAVYGFTQVRKSNQLLKGLEGLKAQDVQTFDMPEWTGKGLQHKTMDVDKAIATVKRRKWTGIGQMAASSALIAAGCITMPGLLVASLAASTAFGVAAVGAEMYANRQEIGERLHTLAASTRAAITERLHLSDRREHAKSA